MVFCGNENMVGISLAMMIITRKFSAIGMLTGLLMILSCSFSCTAMDAITFNSSLKENEETLVSDGGRFELAFFKPNGSNVNNRYVGIRYKSNPEIIVWVANRDHPLSGDSQGVFAIAENGELQVLDVSSKTPIYWSNKPNMSSLSSKSARATLLDSGNLVHENKDGKLVWQSFDHPTDTFLPGMKMRDGFELSSWKNQVDPAVGNFSFKLNQDDENQFIIMKENSQYWKSGVSGKLVAFDETLLKSYITMNFSTKSNEISEIKPKPNTINFDNITQSVSADYNNTRLVLNSDGLLQIFMQRNRTQWILIGQEPKDFCSLFDVCGSFASCNKENQFPCKCLPGFRPLSPEKWYRREFSEGCDRISSVICDNGVSGSTSFVKLKDIRVGNAELGYPTRDDEICKNECLKKCQCQAYSFSRDGNSYEGNCRLWLDDPIKNIQELYPRNGLDINVSVKHSDIEPSKRSCETCGANIIPYPLSTGSQCGDPMYNSFVCENHTGQVLFKVSNGSYRVTNINAESFTFSIQVSGDCTARDWQAKFLPLGPSSPFLFNGCNLYDNIGLNPLLKASFSNEAKFRWKNPLEPLCNSTQDCDDLLQATCKPASDGKKRCLCNKHFRWDSKNITCIQGSRPSKIKQMPYLSIFLGVIAAILLVFCAIIYLLYLRKHRMVISREKNRESIQSTIGSSGLNVSERRVKEFLDSGQFKEDDKKGIDVPFIDLESILAATDDFSDANKLGQGGFGPVYKGKFPGGQEIAVKRLSSGSGQGLEEFKNEVILIAKLQHRNLVRLLGYYVDRYEKMLIYEYMPNRSLDAFIFDRTLCVHLNWELRFNIIMGIARGLLYLHHDSRLRIIHRDLKTSNVLLDEEMTPKISDFGLARIFDGKQSESSTQRVVGTYGYMSPEYALEGFFSIKSDVFSFGVVVLEILSGKRNTAFYKSEQSVNLLGYAWRMWKEQKALELMDNAIRETCNGSEFVRCLNVGLLCVQEEPNDRPTMSTVLFMLGSEIASLPIPKEPVFIVKRSSLSGTTSSTGDGVLELTTTLEQGR